MVPGFGPITNTRTLDDAIREAIARLSLVEPSPRARKLLADARRYQELMSTWENEPPSPEEQFEIIGNVLQLLGTAMRFVEQAASKSDSPVPRPAPRHDSAPVIEVGGGHLALELELETDEPFRGESLLHRVVEIDAPDPPRVAGGVRVVRPHLVSWQPTCADGVVGKRVCEDAGGKRHLLLRLDPGAVLPGQRHDGGETVQVIDGCLRMDGDELPAGSYVCCEPGAVSPDLESVGETTLLLIGTDRRLM